MLERKMSGCYGDIRAAADNCPRISQEEATSLAQRKDEGDVEAINQLVLGHFRLLLHHAWRAKKTFASSWPIEELLNEAFLGFHRAILKYDWRWGVQLQTYAHRAIKQWLRWAVAESSHLVRICAAAQSEVARCGEETFRLSGELRRPPTHEEVAKATGLPLKRVATRLANANRSVFMETSRKPGSSDDAVSPSCLKDHRTRQPHEEADLRDKFRRLRAAISRLPPRERSVIELLYGFSPEGPLSHPAIAQRLGLCNQSVHNIEKSILNRWRKGGLIREDA